MLLTNILLRIGNVHTLCCLCRALWILAAIFAVVGLPVNTLADVIDKQQALNAQTWWDNRDWDWYKANIPFFECPDADLVTTWYYRWELLTKHLTYGSPNSGYSFTEFMDSPLLERRLRRNQLSCRTPTLRVALAAGCAVYP